MSKPSLREEMPTIARIIDDFRAVFGKAYIDSIIRAGMNGQPVFYASENGHSIGTPIPPGALPAVHQETRRERHYRESRARSIALTTGQEQLQATVASSPMQTSAPRRGVRA